MSIDREYKEIISRQTALENELKTLPRGYLRARKIGGAEYYYLQYREGAKVKSVYVKQEDAEDLRRSIDRRKQLFSEWKNISAQRKKLEGLQGIHESYRPAKNVDYGEYAAFMSVLAHDLKRLGRNGFLQKHDTSKYRGLKKRYLKGFIDYILGIERSNTRKGNDLVLDPFTYQMYFKYGKKDILEEELQRAIPAFLNQGLLITNVQEAVNGSSGGTGLS